MQPGPAHPCRDADVFVVVDPGALDRADAIARCAPNGAELDGVAALEAAGFSVTGVARFGRAFVCRIDGRPGRDEVLELPGDDTHREACRDTPPTTAYWSYWHAAPGACTWTYSSTGATDQVLLDGSAEGWSFALGAKPGAAPEPSIGPCERTTTPGGATLELASDDGPAPPSGRIDPMWGVLLATGFVVVALLVRGRARRSRRDA